MKKDEVIDEKHIPFEINKDPFYSDANIKHLTKIMEEIESGEAKLIERELIEVDD